MDENGNDCINSPEKKSNQKAWFYLSSLYVICLVLLFANAKIVPHSIIFSFFCKDPTPFDILLDEALILKDIPVNNCHTCNYKVHNEAANSQNNDLVIGVALGGFSNEFFFSRTLRTVGSKCKLVFLCDRDAFSSLTKDRYEQTVRCGAQFIVLDNKKWIDYWSHAAGAYYYVLAFLLRNRGKFNRIIFQDLFDSIFQGDPFTTDLIPGENVIHVADEVEVHGNSFSQYYYKKANIPVPQRLLSKTIVNSAHFSAYQETMIRFLELFVSVNHYSKNWFDQATANYLEFGGFLRKYNLRYANYRESNKVLNINQLPRNLLGPLGDIHARNSVTQYATIIHHTWTSIELMKNMLKHCPIKERNPPKVQKYFGKCGKECVTSLMAYLEHLDNMTIS